MNQMTKGHGYFRKSKTYGLVCGIALAGSLMVSTQAKADELVEVTPAVTLTANPATNLPEAQLETPAVNTALANEAGTQTGELVSDVVSPALDQAVAKATEAGVAVTTENKVTYDSLASAQADLAKQETAVKEATAKQEANTTAINNAVAENKAIDKANEDEKTRVEALNKQGEADTQARNEAGQKAVDAENAKAQEDADTENTKRQADYDKAVAAREAVVSSNTAIQAEYKAKLAEYERQKADYNTKKEAYDKAIAAQGADNAEYQKAEAEYDKAKAAYDVAKAEYDVAKEAYDRSLAGSNLADTALASNDNIYLTGSVNPNGQGLDYYRNLNVKMVTNKKLETLRDSLYWSDNTTVEPISGFVPYNGSRPLDTYSDYTYTGYQVGDKLKIKNVGHLSTGEPVDLIMTITRDENFSPNVPKILAILKDPYSDGIKFVAFNQSKIGADFDIVTADGVKHAVPLSTVIGDVDFMQHSKLTFKDGTLIFNPEGSDLIEHSDKSLAPSVDFGVNEYDEAPRGTYLAAGYGSTFNYYHAQGYNHPLVTSQAERDQWGANFYKDTGSVRGFAYSLFGRSAKVSNDVLVEPIPPVAPTPPTEPEGNVPQAPKPPVAPTPPQLEDVPPMPEKPQFVSPVVKTFTPEVYVPLEPKVTPHVPVPAKENHKAKVHPVEVKQTPNNVKAVENSDKVSVNGQLVPKNDLITWTLTNTPLKAGRDEITSYVMTDPIPAGFVLDAEATEKANPAWTFGLDEAGSRVITATKATLDLLNKDVTKDVAVPVVTLVGRPVNDGGTYENTFKTTITTPKGQYTTISNTPKIYTPGDDSRTYNGQVIIRYRSEDGDLEIRKDVIDVEDGKVGSPYDTTDNRPDVIAFEGKRYERTSKVVGSETGEIVKGKTYVTYYYKLVPNTPDHGSVIVHYEDEEGRPIKNDVVDTPEAPVGSDYDTRDNKPNKIKTNDGVEYELIPNKTRGKEDGKITSGTIEVTYVYKRTTPKPPTPTPDDNLIKPKKDVVDDKGVSINGKQVLPNTPINYVLTQDFDQYKGMTASKEAIGKGFIYVDDYLDEALDGKSMVVNSITAKNGDDVSSLLEMYHVLSKDSLDGRLAEIVKASGVSPVGEFYLWVAKNPEDFFTAYVQKGLDITYNVSFKIKDKFVGTITNQTFQLDFGNGYYGNIVENDVPELKVNKDVILDGKAVDKGEVKLGDTFEYVLEGWVIPADRGYDIHEYRFVDVMQSSHDDYKGFTVKAKVDITLSDGTVIEKGTDLSQYVVQTYDVETGTFELKFNDEFLAQIPRSSAFGSDVLLKAQRIQSGTVENEFTLYVNGIPVKSDKVVTETPEPPKPPKPEEPKKDVPPTPVTPKEALPQTGDAGSVLGLVGLLLSSLGLVGLKQKK